MIWYMLMYHNDPCMIHQGFPTLSNKGLRFRCPKPFSTTQDTHHGEAVLWSRLDFAGTFEDHVVLGVHAVLYG